MEQRSRVNITKKSSKEEILKAYRTMYNRAKDLKFKLKDKTKKRVKKIQHQRNRISDLSYEKYKATQLAYGRKIESDNVRRFYKNRKNIFIEEGAKMAKNKIRSNGRYDIPISAVLFNAGIVRASTKMNLSYVAILLIANTYEYFNKTDIVDEMATTVSEHSKKKLVTHAMKEFVTRGYVSELPNDNFSCTEKGQKAAAALSTFMKKQLKFKPEKIKYEDPLKD